MSRIFLIILVVTLLAVAQSRAAPGEFPTGIFVNDRAPSFAALAQQAKPTLVFNHDDMVWITRDVAGHHTFIFNRAYNLKPGKSPAAWYLLESTNCWDMPDGFGVIYSRYSNSHPTIIASDPQRGVIYQITWQSNPLSGSGQFTDSRNIFILCDADHHWHFLTEGPVGESGCNGASEFADDNVHATAVWDQAAPSQIHFTFTMLHTVTWNITGGEITPDNPSLTLHYQMVPGAPSIGGLRNGAAPADVSPGLYVRQGQTFLVANKSESFSQLASQLHQAGLSKLGVGTEMEKALQKADPSIHDPINPGKRIILPDQLIVDQ